MEKLRMFDGLDTSEEKISSKKVETPKSSMKDMKKLEHPANLKKYLNPMRRINCPKEFLK